MARLRVPQADRGRPRTGPQAVLGDRAYSPRATRACDHAASARLSHKQFTQADHRRRGSRGGRPVRFDAQKYKGRNVIERSFSTIKNWRALATHYDKLALIYRTAAALAVICAWLRQRNFDMAPARAAEIGPTGSLFARTPTPTTSPPTVSASHCSTPNPRPRLHPLFAADQPSPRPSHRRHTLDPTATDKGGLEPTCL